MNQASLFDLIQSAPAPGPLTKALGDPALAAKLRALAEGMTDKIQQKLHPTLADLNPTPRRSRMIQSSIRDGERLRDCQNLLLALADHHETGTAPPEVAGIATRVVLEDLLTYPSFPDWNEAMAKRMVKAGIENDDQYQAALAVLISMLLPPDPEEIKAKLIADKERELIGIPIPGFFPTPPELARQMLSVAFFEDGQPCSILEPSAGRGDIAQEARRAHPGAKITVCEIVPRLQEILELKGFPVADADFFDHQGKYDRILMNPPFEKGQDIDHVQHAFSLLEEGGRLVSIMCEGVFFRNDKKSTAFREWLETLGGTVWRLEQGAFKSSARPTGIAARIVAITRKGDQQ